MVSVVICLFIGILKSPVISPLQPEHVVADSIALLRSPEVKSVTPVTSVIADTPNAPVEAVGVFEANGAVEAIGTVETVRADGVIDTTVGSQSAVINFDVVFNTLLHDNGNIIVYLLSICSLRNITLIFSGFV